MGEEANCIFCKICAHKQPTELFYEDDDVVVFKDIKPASKHHFLVVTKAHIKAASYLTESQKTLLEKMMEVGRRTLSEQGGDLNDVRLGFHWPPFTSISHLHLHVISPTSEMGFMSRQIFRPNTLWFVTADKVLERLASAKL